VAKDIPKKIAFTDFEMTGLNPTKHEIVEIGLIVADGTNFKEISRLDTKVKPDHIEQGDPNALKFIQYDEDEWKESLTPSDAFTKYCELTKGSIFAAWNSPYDWTFLVETLNRLDMKNPMDYHTIDIFTAAYEKLDNNPNVPSLHLSKICEYFGLQKEPSPHRAINGAEVAFEVYKKLREVK
jgi:DNA polymerase III epsilon subunit-like protein